MRKILMIILLLGSMYTNAQSRFDSLPDIFNRRTSQRLMQVNTYVQIIGNVKYGSDTKKYYINKVSELFSIKAKAVLKFQGERYIATIDTFYNYLSDSQIIIKNIDSIYVPKAQPMDFATDKDTVYLKAEPIKFPFSKSVFSDTMPDVLPAYSVETEEGIEWLPLFGNIIINCENISDCASTSMKRTNKKEENEDIIDIIRNLFYIKR